MTVIDRAHRLVLILLTTIIPLIYLVDLVAEIINGDITVSPGWQVYGALVGIGVYQIRKRRWDADWVIVGGGLGTTILGVLSHNGYTTSIDLTAAVIIVPIVGLVATAVSRHAPVLTGASLGIASVVLATIAFTHEILRIDDLITKSAAVAILFGLGAWLLYQLRRGYEEQYEARDRFVATVSHELRTPLTALAGFTEALGDGVVDPCSSEAEAILALMSGQAHEAADIVEDLLVAARSEAGQVSVHPLPTRLDHEVDIVLNGLSGHTPDIEDSLEVATDPVNALADPLRTRQIVRNLVTNAIRHGGPEIQIRTFATDDHGVVTVSDNGEGFGTDEVETLFTAYGRSRRTDVRNGSIGLGLTVSRELANLMDGTLEAQHVGGVTTFRLSLPLASDVAVH